MSLSSTYFDKYKDAATTVADKYSIPRNIFAGLIDVESQWNPYAVGSKGEIGITQLMPDTARSVGVTNAYDPEQSLEGGAAYLKQQYDHFGNWKDALAAYNAGPSNIAAGMDYANKVLNASTNGNYTNLGTATGQTVDQYGNVVSGGQSKFNSLMESIFGKPDRNPDTGQATIVDDVVNAPANFMNAIGAAITATIPTVGIGIIALLFIIIGIWSFKPALVSK